MRKVTNRTMYLYHVTHKNNWFPVGILGLKAKFSASKLQSVFLVTKSAIPFAIKHVADRDGFNPDDMIVVKVRVRRGNLSRVTWRNCPRGLWRHNADIPPCRIEGIKSWPGLILP